MSAVATPVPPGYAPFDPDAAGRLAAPLLDEPVEAAEEIGDGNLNLVFRVQGGGRSVIVKQALPYLRLVGAGWPLTLDRARIEGEALLLHGRLAPGHVPRLLSYEPRAAALVLEDLREHSVWRRALVDGRAIPGVPTRLGDYCARTLLGTSDLLLGTAERRALRMQFHNPELCAITEQLVFTFPYVDSPFNRFDEAIADLAERLRRDRPLVRAAAELRYRFRTRAEAVLHGDLHTGSVLATPSSARAFDVEFAFNGPMGFDLGSLLANLALSRLAHAASGNGGFATVVDDAAREFWAAFVDAVARLWPEGEPWRAAFVGSALADAAGYMGMEMIRRIVGLAHVEDIDALAPRPRLRAQHAAIEGARELVLGGPVRSIEDLWTRATEEGAST